MSIIIPIRFQSSNGVSDAPPGRPVIPVILFQGFKDVSGKKALVGHEDEWRHQYALIDTGADHTVISRDLAERLELKPKAGFKVMNHGVHSSAESEVVLPNIFLPDCNLTLDTDAVVADMSQGASILIGMNVISQGKLTLDFNGHNYSFEYLP